VPRQEERKLIPQKSPINSGSFAERKREICERNVPREKRATTRGEKTHFPQKSPVNSGSFAERDQQL